MAKKLFMGLLIALMLTAAVSADPALNGVWLTVEEGEFRFENGNWEIWGGGIPMLKGTFSTEDGMLAMETTHWHGYVLGDEIGGDIEIEPIWHSRSELLQIFLYYSPYDDDVMTDPMLLEELNYMLDFLFAPHDGTYSVSGDTLTLTWTWLDLMETIILTRR